jgi:phosphoribosylanthranilate isomerase
MMLEDDLIQVAGVLDQAEADMLQECGIRYLGFPLRLPVHPPDLSEADAERIIRGLAPRTAAVLITYLDRADEIVAFCRSLGAPIVQLHGDIECRELARLKTIDPTLTVIKSLVVGSRNTAALERLLREITPFVDAFITDTFDPSTGASGATGRTHDWTVSRRIVERAERPVILAGGLTPENVAAAILQVRPAGVDAHTGLEDPDGRKSPDKVRRFVAAAREAFAHIKAGQLR